MDWLWNNALALIAAAIVVILLSMIIRLEWRLNRIMRGRQAKDLEEVITGLSRETDRIRNKVIEIIGVIQDFDSRLRKSVSRIKTVRFNPFRGEGGNQSFATAFLDDTGNGVVISSLYSRDKIGIYAKPIRQHKSEYELTREEREAINGIVSARPPVVVILGHVDHGKSTLLDFIRQTKVVESEAGGITQHFGAYEVKRTTPDGVKSITFLDTPGHEAFSAIRERGTQIADLAILVVSAEDGVKAQTLEAQQAVEAAGRPYLVAINKIDRPNANPERTKQSLAENGILVESYGGKIPSINISAKTGAGIDELLDLILLTAELEHLTGRTDERASGFILETNRDARVGVTATLIIKNGTLALGDFVVAGPTFARVKKLENYHGESIKTATFSAAVKVYGFTELPPVGATFQTFHDKKMAEAAVVETTVEPAGNENDKVFAVPITVKADVAGSLEAMIKEIIRLSSSEATFKITNKGLGSINENDVKLAAGSANSLLIGFNVKVEKAASELAARLGLTIETSNVIYQLTDWLKEQLEQHRPKDTVEKIVGEAKLLKLFNRTKDKQVIGGQVTTGELKRGREVKILRRGTEIERGRITDLEQNKQKVGVVEEGKQFGAVVEAKIGLAPGDVLQTFELVSE